MRKYPLYVTMFDLIELKIAIKKQIELISTFSKSAYTNELLNRNKALLNEIQQMLESN